MAIEQTFVLLKPDAVERRLCGRILSRFEERGFRIVGLKMLKVTPELSKQHYAEHVEKPFYPLLEEFITSAPVVAMVLEAPEAVQVVRDMMGKTNGRESAPGTIRGDYGLSRQMNLIHGSDSVDSAKREIAIYFDASELLDHTPVLNDMGCASDER